LECHINFDTRVIGIRRSLVRRNANFKARANERGSFIGKRNELFGNSILVVSHLDRFVDGCVTVAGDDGTSYGQPAGKGGIYQPTVKTPDFDPLTLSVNWKSLPSNLMYEILSLPYQIETLNRKISNAGEYDDPPEYASFFWERQHGYAAMGLEFVRIAKLLRQHANLPPLQSINREWSRDEFLSDQKNRFEKMRDDHQRTMQPVSLPSLDVKRTGSVTRVV
jgi:hypothetical protein